MPMVFAIFKTKKEAEAFGRRAFNNPKVKKVKDGWKVWNEKE